jgi:hypothetical protein
MAMVFVSMIVRLGVTRGGSGLKPCGILEVRLGSQEEESKKKKKNPSKIIIRRRRRR